MLLIIFSNIIIIIAFRRGGLIVSGLVSGLSGPGLSPGARKAVSDHLYLKTEKCIRLWRLYEGNLISSLGYESKTTL